MRRFRFHLAARLLSAACGGRRFPPGFVVAGLMGLAVLVAAAICVLTLF